MSSEVNDLRDDIVNGHWCLPCTGLGVHRELQPLSNSPRHNSSQVFPSSHLMSSIPATRVAAAVLSPCCHLASSSRLVLAKCIRYVQEVAGCDHTRLNTAAWDLLWKLATNARMASAVGDIDLYQEDASRSTIANRWRRLKKLIPATLARYVVPGGERATYRLDLRGRQIHLF